MVPASTRLSFAVMLVRTPRWAEYGEHREQILLGALEAMGSDVTTLK